MDEQAYAGTGSRLPGGAPRHFKGSARAGQSTACAGLGVQLTINLPDFKLAADSALIRACLVVGHTQAVMVGEIKAECRFNGEAVFSCDLPCTGELAPVRIATQPPTHASKPGTLSLHTPAHSWDHQPLYRRRGPL